MKRVVACPECGATSRIGPVGEEDGVVEVWGKAGDKIVLHCTVCTRSFLGRMRLVGRMRTWQLDRFEQMEIGIRHSSATGHRPAAADRSYPR